MRFMNIIFCHILLITFILVFVVFASVTLRLFFLANLFWFCPMTRWHFPLMFANCSSSPLVGEPISQFSLEFFAFLFVYIEIHL